MGLCKSFICTLTDIYLIGAGADQADRLRYVRTVDHMDQDKAPVINIEHYGATNYKSKQ